MVRVCIGRSRLTHKRFMENEVATGGDLSIEAVIPAKAAARTAHLRAGRVDVTTEPPSSELLNFVKALARDLARTDAEDLRCLQASNSRKGPECQQTTISPLQSERSTRS